MAAEPPSGTVTLLFTDIEGSTRLLERTGSDAYAGLLAEHRRLLGEAFRLHDGFQVGTEGDAVFVAFPTADEAASAAADAQRALAAYAWPPGSEVRVRMGLHSGEPLVIGGNYVGLDVHRAARVMAAGHGGQVLVSETTRALLGDRFAVRDLGDHRLKDLAGVQHLYQLLVDGAPTEFPPLRSLSNRPTNLPAQANAFVGRERELAEIGDLLRQDDVRLLTLTGPGGSGKTRLALESAGAALDEFANGVFAVSLAPVRDWELVVPTVAQTLGLREQSGGDALETLTDYVRDRELLLLLDNLEQVLPVAAQLGGLLAAAPALKILATSRTPLRLSGEHAYAVRPLPLDEAVGLFVERARAAVAGFALDAGNEEAVREICLRLEGLPLAIELAAPRVRTLTPVALLRRLDRRLAVLTGGAPDLDERQRTLRATIEWSYDLLEAREQALFARLGIFVRGCRVEAAEAVCDRDAAFGPALFDALASLVEASLLRRRVDSDGEPRFSMLESIREFALERLDAAGETETARRLHGGWFAALAESLDVESRTGDQAAAIARVVDDYPNFRVAIERAREDEDVELMLRLATALWPFWVAQGYVGEGRAVLEEAIRRAGRRPARALLGLSSLRMLSASSDGLLDDVHEALQAAEELGDPVTLAQAWNLLGRVEGTLMGNLGRAEEAWTQALDYADRANLRAERGESIGWLMMSANFGPLRVDEGIARCRRFHDASDDPVIRANSCIEQAALEAMRGEFAEARTLLAGGRQALTDLGFTLLVAMSAQEAHYVERLAGDAAAATAILRESYGELESMGERAYLSTAAALLAHMLYEQDELTEAEEFSRVSEATSAPVDAFSQLLWRSARAKIFARGGRPEAEALAREAVELADATDMLNPQGDTRVDLGEVLWLAGRTDAAGAAFEEAAARFEQKGNLVSLAHVRTRADELAGVR